MRQLILFRHAKTEPFSETGTDETRRLTDRGHEDAILSAEELRRLNIVPDCALVSTARRTRETWAEFNKVFPNLKPIFRDGLYLATPEEIADEISSNPDCGTLLVLGHNEGLHEFALQLAEMGGSRNNFAMDNLRVKFPTAAVAVFTAKEDEAFSLYNFELAEFLMPKALRPAA